MTLNVAGAGPHQLVLSHPVVSGKKTFTAFRGSLQIRQDRTLQEVHVGMRSGESLALADLNLVPGTRKAVKVSLVYPADATPGHLLSVVPVQQLAMLHRRKQQQRDAQVKIAGVNPAWWGRRPLLLRLKPSLLLLTLQLRGQHLCCLLYTSPSPRDKRQSRMPSSA